MKDIKTHTGNHRRKFLKKALYATPSLIVLGTLAKPTNLLAIRSGTPVYRNIVAPTQTSGKSLNNTTSI